MDVARLQRVLSWRELGFDLEQVAALIATDGTTASATEQLREQQVLLLTRIQRLQAVAATVAKTLEAHEMGINLTPEEMLDDDYLAERRAEIVEHSRKVTVQCGTSAD